MFKHALQRVEQRTVGMPYGECVRATYAMLFDEPIENIPRFDPAALNGRDQKQAETEWLASLGYGLIEIKMKPGVEVPEEILETIPEVYHLISGPSARGFMHRCLGFAGRVVADPHPDQSGLVRIESVALVVPLENMMEGAA